MADLVGMAIQSASKRSRIGSLEITRCKYSWVRPGSKPEHSGLLVIQASKLTLHSNELFVSFCQFFSYQTRYIGIISQKIQVYPHTGTLGQFRRFFE